MNDETFIQPGRAPHDPGVAGDTGGLRCPTPADLESIFADAKAKHPKAFELGRTDKPRRVGRTVLWLATMGVLGFIATVLWCWLAYRTGMAVDQWLFKR